MSERNREINDAPPSELPAEVLAALARLDDLVEKFDMHPDPTVRDRAIALLNAVDVVHRAGIRALIDVVAEAGAMRRALDEPTVRLLVELYDVQSADERTRAVLESVSEHVEGHGGRLDIVETGGDFVHVRVASLGHTCEGRGLTEVAEREIREQMPDITRVVVDNADPPVAPGNFVPLTSLRLRRPPALDWRPALPATELPPGSLRGVIVEDQLVLLANVGGQYVAYVDRCPGSRLPLHGATVEGDTLVCPWHHCVFDLRDGRRLDEHRSSGDLQSVALSIESGELRIGIPQGDSV